MWNSIILSGFADEIDPMLEKQAKVLRSLGMSFAEVRGVDGRNLTSYSIPEVKEIAKRFADRGIRISQIGSPIGKIGIGDDFKAHFALFQHTVEIAHILDTDKIRIFSFYMPKGEDADSFREKVLERLGRMADYAAANGAVLLHENEKGIYGDTAPRCLTILKELAGPHFGAVFDFANFVQVGQDTEEAYELLRPYVRYIHIKDARAADGGVVPPGEGDGKLPALLRRFCDSGYEGFLSLEPHLADFSGFSALERGEGVLKHKLTGAEAFRLSHDSLGKILETI
ncbi:MAG: sugar phosphate isomerase/epimerase [Lachnospiraceae bacterium]|nr:sugar phosphate isomerase/epimerase [Lachnospiraceae bacterium]